MSNSPLDREAIETVISAYPADTPLFVLNLLRFRDQAHYGDGIAPAGATGRECFLQGYMPAFAQVAAAVGVEGVHPIFIGEAVGSFIRADDPAWDVVAIIQYPSGDAFRRIALSPEYGAIAAPYQDASLETSRLIGCAPGQAPS